MAESSHEQDKSVESYTYTELFERARQVNDELAGMLCLNKDEITERCDPLVDKLNQFAQEVTGREVLRLRVSGNGLREEQYSDDEGGFRFTGLHQVSPESREGIFKQFVISHNLENDGDLLHDMSPRLYMLLHAGSISYSVGEYNTQSVNVHLVAAMDGSSDLESVDAIKRQKIETYTEALESLENVEAEEQVMWLMEHVSQITAEFEEGLNTTNWHQVDDIEQLQEIGRITNELLGSPAFRKQEHREALVGLINETFNMRHRHIRVTAKKYHTVEVSDQLGWRVKTEEKPGERIMGNVENYIEFNDDIPGSDLSKPGKAVLVVRFINNEGVTRLAYISLEDIEKLSV